MQCEEHEFLCDEVYCLEKRQVCDGIVDCGDSTDEENCPNVDTDECLSTEFKCDNGLCIDADERCNGYSDCLDDSDEQNCQSCKQGAFQ